MNNITNIQSTRGIQRLKFVSFGEEEKELVMTAEVSVNEEKHFTQEVVRKEEVNLITQEQLNSAKKEGHDQGYQEGYKAAEEKLNAEAAKREDDVKMLLGLIANRVTISAEEHKTYLANQQDIMGKIILSAAKKIAGDAIKSDPYAAVEQMLRECLALIAGEPKIIIQVPKDMSAGLKQRIDAIRPQLAGFAGELVIEESQDLKGNDCTVQWKNGYAEYDVAKLWNEIETIISRIRISS